MFSGNKTHARREFLNKSLMSRAGGLEIKGMDISCINDHDFIEIYGLLLEHKILVFRDQAIDSNAYLDFAKRLGDIKNYPFSKGLPEFPDIVEIRKEPHQTINFSGKWHTDSTYLEQPPEFTLLKAIETPLLGGDTLFANTHLAYNALSDGMKTFLASVKGVNVSNKFANDLRSQHLPHFNKKSLLHENYQAIHNAVKCHEETNESSIYENHEHTVRFDLMNDEESFPILNDLFDHIAKPEFSIRVPWQKNTLVLWDNRSLQHKAINDYNGHLRLMHRIIVGKKLAA